MVFSNHLASGYSVVTALVDEYSGGKARKEYCKKGDVLFVISDRNNVLVVFGKNGFFPILTVNTKEIMVTSPEDLINKIKETDLKTSYCFPVDFIIGITENKPWEAEFVEKLKISDVRASLKKEIIERYENSQSLLGEIPTTA